MEINKSVVDFVPEFVGGDLRKVVDHGLAKINQKMLAIFNHLQIELGTLDDFPHVGCLEELLKLHFTTDEVYSVEHELREKLSTFNGGDVSVEIQIDDADTSNAKIIITLDDVPGYRFLADIVKRNQSVKIVNPNLIEVK